MSDKLVTRNGETVEIDSMIEALERTPDRAELLQALKGLRADKVKKALGETVRAAQFDLTTVFNEYLADGEKSKRTVETYERECGRFFGYLDRTGTHTLQATRADINRFKEYRLKRSATNSVRLALASCSSFYKYLEAEEYITRSPFANIKYPPKEYKKAVKPDQGKPVPVMNDEEYTTIFAELKRRALAPVTPGARASEVNRRDSAHRLLPIIHFMGTYGLRIGDVLTVRMEDGDRFSVRAKGGKVRGFDLKPQTRELLHGIVGRWPFKGIGKSTVQGAIRKLTGDLAENGRIRHRYSAHDMRHYFAVRLYQETHDVYAVKEALGHSTTTVTEVYLAGLGASEE
ncbi:MAG: tyrosine-type recombinase/integrase [Planctomycetota bacterium]|jgi:integrase